MNTEIWGPSSWKFLYSIALAYPNTPPDFSTIQQYKQFFTSLQYVLPCQKCQIHFGNMLQSNPIDPYLVSSNALFEWISIVENNIRIENGKQPFSKEQILQRYFGSVQNVNMLRFKQADAEGVEMFDDTEVDTATVTKRNRKSKSLLTTKNVLIGAVVLGIGYYIVKKTK